MKKFTTLLLAIAMILAMLCPVNAADGGTAAVSATQALPGQISEVTISLAGFEEADAILVTFDTPAGLTLVAEQSKWLPDNLVLADVGSSMAVCAATTPAEFSGDVLILAFQLPTENPAGSYDINCTVTVKKYDTTLGVAQATATIITDTSDKCGDDLTWSLDDGVLTISGTGDMYSYSFSDTPWSSKCDQIHTVVIEDGATNIGGGAFKGCSNLESVSIPDSVISIDERAFTECISLKSIVIPEGVTCIGTNAFSMSGLESINIPDSVTSIGDYAFCDCNGLKSIVIPEGVTSIGEFAFEFCDLTYIVLPSTIRNISGGAFAYSGLWHVFYAGTEAQWNEISIVKGYFDDSWIDAPRHYNSTGNELKAGEVLTCQGEVLPCSLCNICGTNSLQIDPNGHKYAFEQDCEYCGQLNPVCGENLTWSLVDGVLTVSGTGDMYNEIIYYTNLPWDTVRDQIQTVIIEDGVTSIGDYAFSNCSNLESVRIPGSVAAIGDYAFSNCWNLQNVRYAGTETQWNAISIEFGNTCLTDATRHDSACGDNLSWSLVDGVLTISGTGAMYDYSDNTAPWSSVCDQIDTVLIETSITSIDADAFGLCQPTDVYYGANAENLVNLGDTFPKARIHSFCTDPHSHWQQKLHEPDCTNKGFLEHFCNCGYSYTTDVVPANGHTEVTDKALAATCTTTGLTEGKHCTVCGVVTKAQETIPAKDHTDVTDMAVAATCIKTGKTKGSHCEICGEILVVQITVPATGIHHYENGACIHCSKSAPPASDQLEDLTQTDASAEEIRDAVQSMDTKELEEILKSDSGATADLAALEQKTGGAATVVVKDTSVGIAQQDVQIVGANLNKVKKGKKASLVISTSAKDNVVPEGYENDSAVRFSMTLENVENAAMLDVPVKVTLPIPQKFNPDRIMLVHYHGKNTEVITPAIEKVSGKYYASVVLSGFSDFAMVQKSHQIVTIPGTEPTCVNTGLTAGEQCSACGEVLVAQKTIPAKGHSWKDATCTAPKTCKTCGVTEGKELGHSWKNATCTAPKTCKTCGVTSGKALGHSWKDATCTAPKTCKTCGATEGKALGHSWKNATCTAPKTCKTCGATEGKALGHSWKNATCTAPKTCKACGVTEGKELGHSWKAATCTAPKTCKTCGATSGKALGHSWKAATCTAPKTCKTCGATSGKELGHNWKAATCTAPKTCKTCGVTSGKALGHSWKDATCTAPKTCKTCGVTSGKELGHSWKDATCTAPKTCKTCGVTSGKELGHSWKDATCTAPKSCKTCGVTEGKALDHSWKDATCTAPKTCKTCGATEGKALDHSWKDATCTAPKTCKTCGATEGKELGHSWKAATCTEAKTCKTCGTKEGRATGHTYTDGLDGTCNVCGIHREETEDRTVMHMFRMYDPNSGEHFYTGSEVERENLVAAGWNYEGVGFTFSRTTGLPVYRLYDPITGEHLYTMEKPEKTGEQYEGKDLYQCEGRIWLFEGVAFNSAYDTEVPQYRLRNPNATRGAYHFTASTVERDNLIAEGWISEGICFYSSWK